MKAAIALSLLGCVFGFSGKALAGGSWGPCTPVDGTTYHYNVDVDVGVPDASKNVAGTVLTDVLNWSNGQNVSIICECPDKGDYKIEKDTLIQGVSGIANMTRDIGGFKYY
ncbi:fimbrial protein, partial [Escherichia coli]|nr:fimbrial protein [Escherichia coli]HAP3745062.1 fimbrial protein [Escherichia coli]